MSGFEIAGAFLGGLPLLISAIEHYDDIVRPYQRFKHFSSELELFRIQLLLERATFRNDSRILLERLTDQNTARSALDRSLKINPFLNEKFADSLGDSLDVWNDAVRAIQDKLRKIQRQGEKFGLVLHVQPPIEPAAQIEWRLQVKQKFKFCFSKLSLDSALADLRTFTNTFSRLCAQIYSLDQPTFQALDKATEKPDKRVGDCQKVRTASVQLYDALSKVCSTHNKHSVQFRLKPHHVDVDDAGRPLIRFNVAFTRSRNTCEASHNEPAWLAIDSVLEPVAEATKTDTFDNSKWTHSPYNTVKGTPEMTMDIDTKEMQTQKTVTIAESIPLQPEKLVGIPSTFAATSMLPDFCLRRDFCICVKRYSQRTLENMDRCMGYFQKSGPCQHLVYFSSPTMSRRPSELISLTEMINRMSLQQRVGSTMPLESVRLAKQLASAVLQFHGTPLLKRYWRSQDVVFFDDSSKTVLQRQTLASPHLDVVVEGELMITNPPSGADVGQLLVRNFYLFSLAKVLLEIAYQKPFAKLHEECGVRNIEDGILKDLMVAKLLSESVSAKLGSTYGEIVRKCLHCDFNRGTSDLNDSALQAVVYREVVLRFEDLEMEMISRMHSQY